MKKILLILSLFTLCASSCDADGRKQITSIDNLPSAARQTISTYFAKSRVLTVIKETELIDTEYEVRLEDGVEIEFDSNGDWKKIDCQRAAVPEQLIPAEILNQTKISFPETAVVEIVKKRKGFDVELSNGLELEFDSRFNFRIDD
ncbi:MAG: PepSY-like domain-containing protein [Bacteroidales bacterium]|nr:PepSY-like domain-containing protein [Bacteroidales bacterium]